MAVPSSHSVLNNENFISIQLRETDPGSKP